MFDIVMVIGICGFIQNFLNVKKNVILIVEVILVEDIGKLLDLLIVDLLVCLFGVIV